MAVFVNGDGYTKPLCEGGYPDNPKAIIAASRIANATLVRTFMDISPGKKPLD